MWRVFITPAAERIIKKLPKGVQVFVFEDFPSLVKKNVFIGSSLSEPLSWLRSFHFHISGKLYRVAYEVDVKNKKIIIHYADYRGGFYERLRRLLHE